MIYTYTTRECVFCDRATKHRHAVDGPLECDVSPGVCVPCDLESEHACERMLARMDDLRDRYDR